MSTQGFQLDPSLANLPLALLRKKYDELSPEERVRLGFVRPATPQEFQAAQQPQGAPADFGGPVYPSSTPPVVSDDTDSGIPVTRTPTGVSFQKQNSMSGPAFSTSNPPAAELAAPALRTVAAQSSGDWFAQNAPSAQAASGDWFDKNAPEPTTPPAKPGFLDRVSQGIPKSWHDLAAMSGAPTSWQELADMLQKGQIPFDPASAMLHGYVDTAVKGVKEGAKEAEEAGANVAEGGPLAANLGKAVAGGAHAALQAIPGIGPVVETAGQDVQDKNYPGAAGGLTNAIAQVLISHGISDPAVLEKVGSFAESAKAGVKSAAGGVGKVATNIGTSLDPDLVGLASPRLAHGLRLAAKVGKVATKVGADAPELDLTAGNKPYAGESSPPTSPAPQPSPTAAAVSESPTDALAREGDIQPVLRQAYRDTLTQKIGNPDTPYADRIRAVTELHELDHPDLKQIPPRSADATRQRFKGMSPKPATAPNASPAASVAQETAVENAQEPSLRESLAAPPPKTAIKPSQVEQTLREALGASAPLKKGVPLKYQGAASATTPAPETAADSSLPKGFTPVKSSVLKGYNYDPETREFHSVTNSGKHYVTGEITPKDVEDFKNADSQGGAWTNIIRSRGTPLGEMVEGKLKPWRTKGVTATPDDLSPLDQKLKNLQDFLQPSAKSTKSLADLDAPSEDLTGEWGQALTKAKKAKNLRELQ